MRSLVYLPLLIAGIFAVTIYSTEKVTFSNTFGWLGFSIATGSVVYFMIFAPYGLRTHKIVFGRRQRYLHPVAEIPHKIVLRILCLVILSLGISFGFYTYAI